MTCRETDPRIACYTDASGVSVSVWEHFVYDTNTGALTAVVYTDVNGTPIDTSAGAVVPGECVDCRPVRLGLQGFPTGGNFSFPANLRQFCISVVKATATDPVTISFNGQSETIATCFTWCQTAHGCSFFEGPISVSGGVNTSFNVDWQAVP